MEEKRIKGIEPDGFKVCPIAEKVLELCLKSKYIKFILSIHVNIYRISTLYKALC